MLLIQVFSLPATILVRSADTNFQLNNPVGGLGLTTGLLDAAHLGQSLQQVFREGADPSVLTTYAQVRRNIYRERTDELSTSNLMRLMSTDPVRVKESDEFFARLKDPNEFVIKLQAGLPDFALTSTSETKFDTFHETTWFISVTQPDDWTREQFLHEYKTVHAGMTKADKQAGLPLHRYVQLSDSDLTVPGTHRPSCDFVTCLTFPNLFVTHAGLRDPNYRATAGKHIFCRLDQKGCLVRKVAQLSNVAGEDGSNLGAIRALVFHHGTAQEWRIHR
ncbi:3-(3-hydroxyphenyl)propionate 2-hydroxylase [Fusarium bulbicola]|nr:3-(3-hydroxyphenyl)propionate 2-hydroxylase [Fusarium bulbicola]